MGSQRSSGLAATLMIITWKQTYKQISKQVRASMFSHPGDKHPGGTNSCHLGRRMQQVSDLFCVNETVPASTCAPLRPDHAG